MGHQLEAVVVRACVAGGGGDSG